jgi:hypothetical protein
VAKQVKISSTFCFAVINPVFDGKSILATVAIHAARNFLVTVGGLISY